VKNVIKLFDNLIIRIKKTWKRAALSTLELMILIVVIAAVVGGAAGIITSKLSNMSDHVDTTLTQVTDDIIKKSNDIP
jgi:ABC-type proline/glycine betaine transport system permease subunit